jgi:preprotein translocase subunit SecG
MKEVFLVIHLILAIALVVTVLLQRSEGGALGMGGGPGGFMTARGAGDLLSRTTAILAACFFATSLVLTVMSGKGTRSRSILDDAAIPKSQTEAPLKTAPPPAGLPQVPLSDK